VQDDALVSLRGREIIVTPEVIKYPSAEKRDFIDQIVILADEYDETDPRIMELYDKTCFERLTFDKDIAVEAIKQANARVRTHQLNASTNKKTANQD